MELNSTVKLTVSLLHQLLTCGKVVVLVTNYFILYLQTLKRQKLNELFYGVAFKQTMKRP